LPSWLSKPATVVVHDLDENAHSLDVTAESLYEAVAQALAALRAHKWVGEMGKGLTTVTVKVRNPKSHTLSGLRILKNG